ncbi:MULTISPECIES: hypothetical protein [unclassified Sphingobacterium]|uniref:hypothetical protein n=1 Tax=unclassified Sphingobacterium TaxID=2609468 RepID=UPI0025FC98ED|nr:MULTISPECIES: hypothetical protein [unclassified Sphingobacterium]
MYLVSLLSQAKCPFSKIIVNGTKDANIQLHHTKAIDEDGYKGFSHIIYSEKGEDTRIIWKKKNAPKRST